MTIKILMPALSPTMTEGKLQKWLVSIGDEVKEGDVLAEIETDKATMEIEAVDKGKVTSILVPEGSEGVTVNSTIAILNGPKDFIKQNNKDELSIKELKKNKITNDNIHIKNFENNNESKSNNIKIFASPYVKKYAKDNNINLKLISGSGPNQRIIKRDLNNNNNKKSIETFGLSQYQSYEPTSMRKIIAKRTSLAKNTIPHFYLTIESNVDKLLSLRKKINEENLKNNISINDLLIKALAIAQNNNPETNISWIDGKIYKYKSIDISIAVALKEGLLTPLIRNAYSKGLLEISDEVKNLVINAKEGKLKPEEYTGGTISISNLGMYGIREFSAIINPPQSSILAVGSIYKKIKLQNKELTEIYVMKSTLSVDHRVVDGAVAAKMLSDFNDIVENPFDLWLQSKDMEII